MASVGKVVPNQQPVLPLEYLSSFEYREFRQGITHKKDVRAIATLELQRPM